MFTKLVRIGRDAEMKYLPSGTAILEMSVVYDIGFGDKKSSQWVKLAMFGQRAEKLVGHFTKGKQIVATMDDVKAEAWVKDGEARSTIAAKLVEFEFAGGQSPQQPQQGQQQYQQAPAQQAPQSWGNQTAPQQQQRPQAPTQQAPQQRQQQQAQQQNAPAMNFDDDIPF